MVFVILRGKHSDNTRAVEGRDGCDWRVKRMEVMLAGRKYCDALRIFTVALNNRNVLLVTGIKRKRREKEGR